MLHTIPPVLGRLARLMRWSALAVGLSCAAEAQAQLRVVTYNIVGLAGNQTSLRAVISSLHTDNKQGFATPVGLFLFSEVGTGDTAALLALVNQAAPAGYTYANVRRWTKKTDIFAKRRVFFPVNLSNTHWTLLVADMQRRELTYVDSMGGRGAKYTSALLRYLKEEHLDKKKCELPDAAGWTVVPGSSTGCPQQANGIDCGVFTIVAADHLSERLPLNYSQADITSWWRVKIAACLLRGSLDYSITCPVL